MSRDEQYPLQRIFVRLNDTEYCRYTQNGDYPIVGEDKALVLLHPREMLEVGRDCGICPREHVMLAYFGEERTRLLYVGEDVRPMRETIHKLRLPRWSDNVGDRVFSRIRNDLHFAETGSGCFEYTINPGNEYHFRVVLKKLAEGYEAGCSAHLLSSLEGTLMRGNV